MELIQKFGKLLLVNIVILIILLITLLFFLQKQGGQEEVRIEDLTEQALLKKNIESLYSEATEDKPLFLDRPKELEISQVEILVLGFVKDFDTIVFVNDFAVREPIRFAMSVTNYMDPLYKKDKYVYGLRIRTETYDSDGNLVASLSQDVANIDAFNPIKGLPLSFNIELIPDSAVQPGEYKMKVIAFDKISELQSIREESFTII